MSESVLLPMYENVERQQVKIHDLSKLSLRLDLYRTPAELRIFRVYPRKDKISVIYQERDVRVYLFPARLRASTLVCVACVCVTYKLHVSYMYV